MALSLQTSALKKSWWLRHASSLMACAGRPTTWLVVAFLVAGAFCLWPIWSVRYLPLLDMPQHLSIIHILHHFDEPRYAYQQYVSLHPMVTTYLTYYYGVDWLSAIFPIETANKIFISLYVLSFPLSLMVTLRVFGRNPWPGLLGFPLVFSYPFYMGFISYCLSLPLLFFGIALWEALLQRPTRRRLILAALHGPLLFFTHALTFLIAFGTVGWLLLVHLGRRPWQMLRRAALLSGGLALMAIWVWATFTPDSAPVGSAEQIHAFATPDEGIGMGYRPVAESLNEMPQNLLCNLHGDQDEKVLVVWALLLLALLIMTRTEEDDRLPKDAPATVGPLPLPQPRSWLFRHRLELLAWLFCTFYFIMPMSLRGIWAISPRMPVLAAAALVLLPNLRLGRRWQYLIGLPLLALAIWQARVVQGPFASFQKEVGQLDQLLAPLEDGRRIYGLIYDAGSEVVDQAVYLHFACYYMLQHGGMTNFSFVHNPAVPIRHRNPAAFPYPGKGGEWHPERFLYSLYGASYDYFLVRDTGGQRAAALGRENPELEWLGATGAWTLYRNRPEAAGQRSAVLTFRERIAQAKVQLASAKGQVTACDRWQDDRWQCPTADWVHVKSLEMTFAGRSMPCIWAHPAVGQRLEIEFPDVPLEEELGGFVGLSDDAVDGTPDGVPVRLEVTAGGQSLGVMTRANQRGIQMFRLDTRRFSGLRKPVRFVVTATSDARRHFCFDAQVFDVRQPAGKTPTHRPPLVR